MGALIGGWASSVGGGGRGAGYLETVTNGTDSAHVKMLDYTTPVGVIIDPGVGTATLKWIVVEGGPIQTKEITGGVADEAFIAPFYEVWVSASGDDVIFSAYGVQ